MSIFEKANEVVSQFAGFATVSLGDLVGSVFMKLVTFFVNLLLGV
jgi:hypothetical protein